MKQLAQRLRERVAAYGDRFRSMVEEEVARKPGPTRWSKKEILGHLIDSAVNNHPRIVRTALSADGVTQGPGYEQEGWVELQGYQHADWGRLVALWAACNTRLADVVERLPASAASARCQVGDDDPLTLRELVEGYLSHLDYHLAQLVDASR